VSRKGKHPVNGDGEKYIALSIAMAGSIPAIHVLQMIRKKDVDGRDKPGHD